ncbi:DUF152 [Prochlorococcus marinus str. MIT 9515]|uniref:Purine nucleoside phosphorylase n=1 Tax=Prochlorococcus marinus (strain MIT 9515) TaxID=167542 RepID=A2BVJ0_PROM5|nr:peptidoglycan editing factor PgeF [Prochlorococcus marinus]ABM71801.1 DUF152 [Prochlorococcus marinus str. MIT 9515]
MDDNQQKFQEKDLKIKDKSFKYFLSPIFVENNFKHGFFTKTSSETNLSVLSKQLNENNKDCILNQIHSNQIVFGSETQGSEIEEADGIFSDKHNQTLWIYTADCMPILFADKSKRQVGAIHCGRKGLENKIIKNIIDKFYNNGCSNEDLIVAIGPSISKKYYLVDNKTLENFYRYVPHNESISLIDNLPTLFKLKKLVNNKNKVLNALDLKKYAHLQLINEKIPKKNIDISDLCTYESNYDFHSWRRSKTYSRQWSFISP